jgi:hypothetical protein
MPHKTVLIHHHIFKNAGTSFNHALKQYFQNNFFEYDLPNSHLVTNQHLADFIEDHPQALAISSHHACLDTPQGVNYQTISSILLRQPLARIESIYKFEHKQQADTIGAIKAKELGFKDYVLWRLAKTPNMFCNYQTHYCSRTKQADVNQRPTPESLKTAVRNLKNCAIVGTVERYEDFLEIANHQLRQFYPDITLNYSFLNRTAPIVSQTAQIRENLVTKLGQDLVVELETKNQLDYKLYQVAQDIALASLPQTQL